MERRLSIVVVLFVAVTSASGYLVQFFDGKDFDGWFYERGPGPDCINFTSYSASMSARASSLKTDVCIMVYSNDMCDRGKNHSIKIPPGEHADLALFHHSNINFDNRIASFKRCADDAWGAADINRVYFSAPGVNLGWFVDYCECVTIPEYMHGKIQTLDNRGNCIKLFSRENCQGDSVDIHGGNSDESRNLDLVKFKGLTKSFSTCGDATTCSRYTAEVFKFELHINNANPFVAVEQVEMAAKTTFRNHGSATVTKDFGAQKTIKELIEINRVSRLTSMTSCIVSKSLRVETPQNFPMSAKMKLKQGLIEAYTYTTNSSTKQPTRFTKEPEFEFTASEHIQLAPCSEYSVSSYVQMIQGYSIDYVLYAKIRGRKGKRVMTTEELTVEFTGMDYVKDFDGSTIIVTSNGTILADLGLEVVVDGEGFSMPACPGRSVKLYAPVDA